MERVLISVPDLRSLGHPDIEGGDWTNRESNKERGEGGNAPREDSRQRWVGCESKDGVVETAAEQRYARFAHVPKSHGTVAAS